MVSRRSFSREFKILLCSQIAMGAKTKAQICRENGLSPGVLDRWVEKHRALGSDAFPNSGTGLPALQATGDRTKELEALVGRLTLENKFLKAAVKKGQSSGRKSSRDPSSSACFPWALASPHGPDS